MILDIGVGNNPNVKADYYYDFDFKNIDNFIQGDAHYLPFKDNSFEIVTSRSAIEHLINPALALQEMMRVASEKVIITTPNLTFMGLHLGELFIDRPGHLYGWSLVSWRNFIKKVAKENYKVECYTRNDINLRGKRKLKWLIELRFLKWIPGRFTQRDLKAIIYLKK